MKEMKQYPLFGTVKPVGEKPVQTENDGKTGIIQLESEAAAKILHRRKHRTQGHEADHLSSHKFSLGACRACGSTKLNEYNNVYVCRTCKSENTYSGVLFGDKVKKGEKT